MATLYTRTYTYTGQENNGGQERIVELSKFTVSGDTTHTIQQIVSVTYEHYHTSTGSPTYDLAGQLIFSDNSTLQSDTATHSFHSDVYKFTNTWSAGSLPSAEQWSMFTKIKTVIVSQSGSGQLYWRAVSKYPMKIIITFYDTPPVVYAPRITKFIARRINSNGSAADNGNYIQATIRLSLAEAGSAAQSSLQLYVNNVALNPYTPANIASMLSSDYTVTLPESYSSGITYNLRLVFTCGEETSEAACSVPCAVATVHMSGCKTGGVALGKFSASAEDAPMFECAYPAHFLKGVHFDDAGSAEINSLFVVPGERISLPEGTLVSGYCTSSKKTIRIAVPIGKFLTNVSHVAVENINGWMRNEGGYGMSSGFVDDGNNYTSVVESTIVDKVTNSIIIHIARSTAFSLTNNQPLTFEVQALTLYFT